MIKDFEAFISYRHSENNDIARRLHEILEDRYAITGFRDEEELHFGDFRTQLEKFNKRSKYLVILLKDTTLDKCNRPGDWVAKEISMFLEKKKIIIPVKMKGFSESDYDKLPEEIRGLKQFDSLGFRCPDDLDDDSLAEFIAHGVASRIRSALPKTQTELKNIKAVKWYLSPENTSVESYMYDSANELRINFFFFALYLFFSIVAILFLLPRLGDRSMVQAMGGVLSVIGILLLLLERKKVSTRKISNKVIVDDGKTERSIAEIVMDYSAWDTFKTAGVSILLNCIPALFISFVYTLAMTFLGFLTQGIEFSKFFEVIETPFFAMMPFLCLGLPLLHSTEKLIISICNMFNAIFGRYPDKIKLYVSTRKWLEMPGVLKFLRIVVEGFIVSMIIWFTVGVGA